MTYLQAEELFQFLRPSLSSLFDVSEVSDLVGRSRDVLVEFISNPSKTLLMVHKDETLVVQTSFSYPKGAVLLCQKQCEVLQGEEFQSHLTVLPIADGPILPIFQAVVRQMFMPYLQSTMSIDDSLVRELFGALRKIDFTATRIQRLVPLDEPVMGLNDEILHSAELSQAQQTTVLNEIDAWKEKMDAVLNAEMDPPEFASIKDEISFWKRLGTCLKIGAESMKKLYSSKIRSVLATHKALIDKFLEEKQPVIMKLVLDVDTFSQALSQFNPDDGFDRCSSVDDLTKKMETAFVWWNLMCEKCNRDSRIPAIYSLLVDLFLSSLSSILYRSGVFRIDTDSREVFRAVDGLQRMWTNSQSTMSDVIRSHQVRGTTMMIAQTWQNFGDRFRQFLDMKKECNDLVMHIRGHKDLDCDDVTADILDAYAIVRNSPVLELRTDLTQWADTIREYERTMTAIDKKMAFKVQKLLSKYTTLTESHEVFKTHKLVCRRERVMAELTEYHQVFRARIFDHIESVASKDIRQLSTESPLTQLIEVRGATCSIARLWMTRHISSGLDRVDTMIKDVLGDDWSSRIEWKEVAEKIDDCRTTVESGNAIADVKQVLSAQTVDEFAGCLFAVKKLHGSNVIAVNFSPHNGGMLATFNSFKQFHVVDDRTINVMSRLMSCQKVYLRIQDSLSVFVSVLEKVEKDSGMMDLAAELTEQMFELIRAGWNMMWCHDQARLDEYSRDMAARTTTFERDMKRAESLIADIEKLLQSLHMSMGNSTKEVIGEIILADDKLFTSRLSNNELHVEMLNKRIVDILSCRVKVCLRKWLDIIGERTRQTSELVVVKISIRSNHVSVHPSVEGIHPMINRSVARDINALIGLNQITAMSEAHKTATFKEIMDLPHDQLWAVHQSIDEVCSLVKSEVDHWAENDVLFRNEPGSLADLLAQDDIARWIDLLVVFDEQLARIQGIPERKRISVVTVDSEGVQRAVADRIRKWRDYVLRTLERNLAGRLTAMFYEIDKARDVMENDIPAQAKDLAAYLHEFKVVSSKKREWEDVMPAIKRAAAFIPNAGQVKVADSLESFNQVYYMREREIEDRTAGLCRLVERECEELTREVEKIKVRWDYAKPLNGDIVPEEAVSIIEGYQTQFDSLNNDWKQLESARGALRMPNRVSPLEGLLDDCYTMSGVWKQLLAIGDELNVFLQRRFVSLSAPKFQSKLNALLDKLQQMSTLERDYEPWSHFCQTLKGMIKCYPIIEGLASTAISERHWNQIFRHLEKSVKLSTLTIGDVCNLDLVANESFFAEILRNAQGEFSLAQYLDQLSHVWDKLQFEFTDFKGKASLIKGCDTVLATISDHLNFLVAMKTSPFFNTFREQAKLWESNLNKLQVTLGEWLDVQRRFVYLEGVFSSQRITQSLGKATTAFKKSEKEFIALGKRALQMKIVMKVLSIPNVDATLQGLNDSLMLLQKELSDYLEKQRVFFPRFFFLGDEDLLEIIGKSSAISEIQRHFGKMFEGLSGVGIRDDEIIEMNCGPVESVKFRQPVNVDEAVYQTLSDIEKQMRESLQASLAGAVKEFSELWAAQSLDKLCKFIESYPSQIALLAFFVVSTVSTESHIGEHRVQVAGDEIVQFISLLSQLVFSDLSPAAKHSVQQLITEGVHHRNIARNLGDIGSTTSFEWTRFLRFYCLGGNGELTARVGDAEFDYGFEYMGLTQSLVRTPLTDRVYLTMAQALFAQMGGSPFGPAGTGKTETVKDMGHHIGRHVLVFNCDETFDFKAMGRIFIGICHCGSWGCFDEFNRLDEQMLSAVSQQIQTIQMGLRGNMSSIEILGKKVPLNRAMGMFITMNPGYAGRVELPDNLKQLFRTMAMNRPDTELITEVMLLSQGFASAEQMAPKFMSLFSMMKESLSHQTHYDFGLRAMKSVLTNAGQLIRANRSKDDSDVAAHESRLIVSSIVNALSPKLLASDLAKLQRLIADIFPGIVPDDMAQAELVALLKEEAMKLGLVASDLWINKVVQMYHIQQISHGFMLVGPSATGKTSSRTTLLNVLSKYHKQESESYVINPKGITKDTLFGCLDGKTREWTDGVFTRILRTIVDDQHGEMSKRHWIVFDGDVDPEWVENLNSVLDDNKLLTLPNGERIALPPNVRIVFEVENLNYATPATVSRCGIIFFSANTLKSDDIVKYHTHQLCTEAVITPNHVMASDYVDIPVLDMIEKQKTYVNMAESTIHSVLEICGTFWEQQMGSSIMELPIASCISSFFSLLSAHIVGVLRHDVDAVMLGRAVLFSAYWAFVTPIGNEGRARLNQMLKGRFPELMPDGQLTEFVLTSQLGSWEHAAADTQTKADSRFVLTAQSAVMHKLIQMFIISGRSMILCGSDGTGKESILRHACMSFADLEVVRLNLASCSSVDFILKTMEQFCVYSKSSVATRMRPKTANTFILFEFVHLNLPAMDKYGTQRVVEFLRQLLDLAGFWHPQRREWIKLEMVSFAGVCCPPTAYGRVPLNQRFLRHANVFSVGHPPKEAVLAIIGKLLESPYISNQADVSKILTDFYWEFKEHFRASDKVHYAVNMRDIVNWAESIAFERALASDCELGYLVFDIGVRVFCDRLENNEDCMWARTTLQAKLMDAFIEAAPESKALFMRVNNDYRLVPISVFRNDAQKKLHSYNEQSSSKGIVLFDECLEVMSKIERKIAQPNGHVLIVGLSGTGKALMASFVAWYSGYKVFRLRIHKEYDLIDFDADLRKVLKTCVSERVCLVLKETDLILPVFTERLNGLLAESHIPGLFAGDELASLLGDLKERSKLAGLIEETEDALFGFFINQVKTNLHVVFTANSAVFDMNKTDVVFPSLKNVCNILWVGSWSESSLSAFAADVIARNELLLKPVMVSTMISIHNSACDGSSALSTSNYVSPWHFFDFVNQFCTVFKRKNMELVTEQTHLSNGLSKLEQTQKDVAKMSKELEVKRSQLKAKEHLAEQKLEEILKDRERTSSEAKEAQSLQVMIDEKRKTIDDDRAKAIAELAEVIPAVEQAKSSVSKIKKANLDEIRRLAQPPDVIKSVLQAVLVLLNQPQSDWASIRKAVGSETFIRSVIEFNVESVTAAVAKKVANLIKAGDLSNEKAQRASQACGPLFLWVSANVRYLRIMKTTEPLRDKVDALEKEKDTLETRHKAMETNISTLKRKLSRLNSEYNELLSECEKTRNETEAVQNRLGRATPLLSSLTSETRRWFERRSSFETDQRNLLGNSMLAACLMTYCGYLEQQQRVDSLAKWMSLLAQNRIKYTESFEFSSFMASPEQLMEWSGKQLPKDDLCVQNAVILTSQSSKTPFVIDPAGQATQFLVNSHSNLVRTSFSDKKFAKVLESCLRFGSPLLVEDGEQFDPLVLPVLAGDVKRASGRALLELKRNEIDVSPAFHMYIVTRDVDFAPSPSLCSLTVLVNFSVTTLSLRAQSMSRLLQFKLPDIERRRKELYESLASMQVELRKREEQMLSVFSATQGDILENDTLLVTLESVKKEAVQIAEKANETTETLHKISATSEQYSLVAEIATSFYFALRDMSYVHYLYQFSFDYFWTVFDKAVTNEGTPEELVERIAHGLFVHVSYSLLQKHLPVFGFRLGQILLEGKGITVDPSLYDLALRGSLVTGSDPAFMKVTSDMQYNDWLSSDAPEHNVPEHVREAFGPAENAAVVALKVLAALRRVRPDRIVIAMRLFVKESLCYDIDNVPPFDIVKAASEVSGCVPLLLCASAGQDPSARVEAAATGPIESLAVGAADSYEAIADSVAAAARRGAWVVVKNVHLAPLWIRSFVKSLADIRASGDFRLFLTSEISPKLGSSVFRACRVIAFESATGIRANLRRAYANGFSWPEIAQEQRSLVINFLWLHAVVMERLRFAPLGWSKVYEFNDTDLTFATRVGARWCEASGEGVPWTALRFLISGCVYGGRVDVPSDQRILQSIAELVFSPDASLGQEIMSVPKMSTFDEFRSWADALPSSESPEVLWLPRNSGKFLFIQQGTETLQHVLAVVAGSSRRGVESRESAYARQLMGQWRDRIAAVGTVEFTASESELIACVMADELASLRKTRLVILHDIEEILDTFNRGNAMTQHQTKIVEHLERAAVPEGWNPHGVAYTDLSAWIDDFIARIDHINAAVADSSLGRGCMQLGLLRSPESLLAAARQSAARANSWPAEDVTMQVTVGDHLTVTEPSDIVVVGTMSLCAEWKGSSFTTSDEVTSKMARILVRWTRGHRSDDDGILVPAFMTTSKKRQVFEAVLPVDSARSRLWWTVRGPSLVLQPHAL